MIYIVKVGVRLCRGSFGALRAAVNPALLLFLLAIRAAASGYVSGVWSLDEIVNVPLTWKSLILFHLH
jgi:hypothetical protein